MLTAVTIEDPIDIVIGDDVMETMVAMETGAAVQAITALNGDVDEDDQGERYIRQFSFSFISLHFYAGLVYTVIFCNFRKGLGQVWVKRSGMMLILLPIFNHIHS